MNYASVFSGIGGFEVGFDRLGWRCVWQMETDRQCRDVLARHWPAATIYDDIRHFEEYDFEAVELVCGGDPCPCRSIARRGHSSTHPDLSGWFLALAGRLRPRWLVRENVRALDVHHFAFGLECLGYRSTVVSLEGADFCASRRPRDFVVGCLDARRAAVFERLVSEAEIAGRNDSASGAVPPERFFCLTAAGACGAKNYSTDNTYIFEENGGGYGLRVLSPVEAERAMGFPAGHTAGAARTNRGRMVGNAVQPPVAEWLGRIISEAEGEVNVRR